MRITRNSEEMQQRRNNQINENMSCTVEREIVINPLMKIVILINCEGFVSQRST